MALDNAKNFAKATVATGYTSAVTTIALLSGGGSRMPIAPFNGTWWNSTDYPDPSDDPNVEIVRVTSITTDTLTIIRAQEGTLATSKNNVAKVYLFLAGLTAKVINTDISFPTFIDNEVVAGSGTTFTLASTPTAGSQHIYAKSSGKAIRLYPTIDYTISGTVITTGATWSTGDILADYRTGSVVTKSTVSSENLTGSGTSRTATQTPVFGIVDGEFVVNGNGYSISGLNITLDNGTSSPFHSFYNLNGSVVAIETKAVGGTSGTFTNTPVAIISNGQLLTNGDGYTLSGNTATFDNSQGTVYSIYNNGGTGTLAIEATATGAYDGSNKIFTTVHTPTFMVVEGQGMVSGDGYSLTTLTETFNNAPVSAVTTHSFYNN